MVIKVEELQEISPNERSISSEKNQEMTSIDLAESSEILVNNTCPEVEQNSLEQIIFSQNELSDIKENLGKIIETIGENPSLLNRAAKYWGDLPTSHKVIAGVALSGPTLIVGIFVHAIPLLILSGMTITSFVTSSVILDDHNTHNVNVTDRLKEGINNLADFLGKIIQRLDKIREQLAKEIEKFKLENIKLSSSIKELGEEVKLLATQTEIFVETEQSLRKDKEELERVARILNQAILEQSEQFQENQSLLEKELEENQKRLMEVNKAYELNKIQLTGKIVELRVVKDEMGKELEKAKKIANTLKGAVESLSSTVIEDEKNREDFQNKLSEFISDKESSFDKVTSRICDAERELAMVKEELKQTKTGFDDLLKKHMELLAGHNDQLLRLEKIGEQFSDKLLVLEVKPKINYSTLLVSNGLYGNSLSGQQNLGSQQELIIKN